MKIVSKWNANYLVSTKKELYSELLKENLYFGYHEIEPGMKIRKFGNKKRTSFEVAENSWLEYEGTLIINDVKHCIFSSSWDDDKNTDVIYRYAFSISKGKRHSFLLIHNKTFQSSRDVDCTIIEFVGRRKSIINTL